MTVGTNLMAAALAALLRGGSVDVPHAQPVAVQPASDTATVRLHISKMTCGSCPLTARLALQRIPGVLGATVTLDDSLGVVRYDPRKVTPAEIAAHLNRLTGYRATVIAERAKTPRRSGE